jgi:hypothetical protein
MVPAAAILITFLAYPLGLGVWLGMTDVKIGRPGQFVGLGNLRWLFDDQVFWLSVFNTFLYTVVASIIKFGLGLWLALILDRLISFKAMLRAVVLLPFIVPTVLSAIAFWWIYDAQDSPLSTILKDLGLITTNIDFLGDPENARASVIAANHSQVAVRGGDHRWRHRVAAVSPHYLPAADPDHRRGHDLLGPVHLHRLPADLGDDPGRTVQRDAPDGDARLSARHRRRLARRGRRDRGRDDAVPGRRDSVQLLRAAAPQVAAGRGR